MGERDVIIGIALEEACLTLQQLAATGAVDVTWVQHRIEEGLLPTVAESEGEWRFSSATLTRVRRMSGIERDFDAAPELAALFADLLEELDEARRLLGRGSRR